MRKTYTFIFCLILSISTTHLQAQNCWSPLGSGIIIKSSQNGINAIATYNGSLIAAGQFDSIGGVAAHSIAAWNGSSWSPLGTGFERVYTGQAEVSSMVEYNGELYVAGIFDTAGGIQMSNIARWDGNSWSAVGSGIPGVNYPVNALAIYNGALYAAGDFYMAGGVPANNIAKWDGTQWSALDSGIRTNITGQGGASCLLSYNGKLYAAGLFNKAGSILVNNIAVWNDTIWSALGNGLGNFDTWVGSLAFYQGNLYAEFDNGLGPRDSLAVWNGRAWNNLFGIPDGGNVRVLFPFDDKLIIGGAFDSIGGIAASSLAQWDGITFSGFGGGVNSNGIAPAVFAFNTYNDFLYAGGQFKLAGGIDSISANSIAEYTCATDGIQQVKPDHVHVYPNPSTGMVNISIDNAEAGSSVQIYDLLGQKIFQSNINSSNTSINLSGHAPGSYLYHISDVNGESISAGTLIIQ